MMELILSTPTTITFLYLPVSTNAAPVFNANRNPLQAAPKSNPKAFFAPSLSPMILAVAGKIISGVTVAQIMQSMSNGSRFFLRRISSMAFTAISELALPGSINILLSDIPVLVLIHSSLVSTIFSKSKFVNLVSGTYPPTQVIAAFKAFDIDQFLVWSTNIQKNAQESAQMPHFYLL